MPVPKSLLAVVLTAAHAAAVLTPCPPSFDAADRGGHASHHPDAAAPDVADPHAGHAGRAGHADHAGHASAASTEATHASSGDAHDEDCHAPPAWIPRCPCGCDQRGTAATPGSRLGPAIAAAAPTREPAVAHAAPTPRVPAVPDRPLRPLDKIPIRVSTLA